MKPKISIITLGVADLAKAKAFYENGMGLVPRPESQDEITFYDMNGAWLSLYPKTKLAEDVGISAEGNGFSGVTVAHNEPSKEGVDEVMETARQAGAEIVKEPEEVFWGSNSPGDCSKRLPTALAVTTCTAPVRRLLRLLPRSRRLSLGSGV